MGSLRVRLVTAAMVLGLFAAGCGGSDGDVKPPENPTTSATDPASSAGPTSPAPRPEPTRPAAMERDDIEGAKAAAQYFLELYPYVYSTGDLEAWKAISHPECTLCASVIKNVRDLHGEGGYGDGPVIDVLSMEAAPPDSEYEWYSVWIDAREGPSVRYASDGTATERIAASAVQIDLAMARTDGQWTVRGAVGSGIDEGTPDASR